MPIAPLMIFSSALGLMSNLFSQSQSRENMARQEHQNDLDREFAHYWNTKQFNEQAFLNRNGYQIAAADMEKAGFNPAMLSGSPSYQAGSYSSVQGTAPQDTSNTSEVLQNLSSQMFGLASTKMQVNSSESIAKANNETQKEVIKTQTDAEKDIAKDKIEAEKDIAKSRIDAEKYIASEKNKNDVFMQNKELASKVAELNQKKLEFEEAKARAESATTLAEKKEAREKAQAISEEIRGYLGIIEDIFADVLMFKKQF